MTSLGVIKVPDGLSDQIGLVGFFYPTQVALDTGAFTSGYPDLILPIVSLNVFSGDLGINSGIPRSVYALDTSEMTRLTGGDTGVDSIQLAPGETADLPDGYGTITFEDESPAGATGYEDSVKRYVSLSIHRDVAAPWVLLFAVIAMAGLVSALFIPRRRMWVKATAAGRLLTLEYAGLARGEDPALEEAVAQFARAHEATLDAGSRPRAASDSSAASENPDPTAPKVD